MMIEPRRPVRLAPCTTRGVAALEFVLVLPFIWIIFVLVFNFGQIFLERQRAFVALRELAIRSQGGDWEAHATAIEADTLAQRGMKATYIVESGATCPQKSAIDGADVEDATKAKTSGMWRWLTDWINSALDKLSSTRAYRATVTGRPFTGGLLKNRSYEVCYAIDDGTWTQEVGRSYFGMAWNWLKDQVKKLF
jgi:hypothetical protein